MATLKGSTLQYFRPSLGYYLSLRYLFYLFLSGHFTQVLLYCEKKYDGDVNNSRKAMTSCSCTGKLIMQNGIPFFYITTWTSLQENQILLHANNKGTGQPGHLHLSAKYRPPDKNVLLNFFSYLSTKTYVFGYSMRRLF